MGPFYKLSLSDWFQTIELDLITQTHMCVCKKTIVRNGPGLQKQFGTF